MLTTFTRFIPRPYQGKNRSPGPHGSQPTLPKPKPNPTPTPASPAKSEEGHVRRRPDRAISAINRSRPPAPVPAINEPAAIVIRRPAPGLVGNPGPAIVGLINPAAIAVRSPARSCGRKPDVAVIGDVAPLAVGVQVLAARIVRIGVLPAFARFQSRDRGRRSTYPIHPCRALRKL